MRVEDFQEELKQANISSTFQSHSFSDEESWVLEIEKTPHVEGFATIHEQVESQLSPLSDEGMKCFVLKESRDNLTLMALSAAQCKTYLSILQEIIYQLKINLYLYEDVPDEEDDLINSVPVLQEDPILMNGYEAIKVYLQNYQEVVYGSQQKAAPLIQNDDLRSLLGGISEEPLSRLDLMISFLEDVPEYEPSQLKKSLDEWMNQRNRLDYLVITFA